MKIGFIGGTGEEGLGLAYRFALAGHECIIGSRNEEKAQAAVKEVLEKDYDLKIAGATNAAAAASSEIVVLTMPYDAQAATLPALATFVREKIVVSAAVPMMFEKGRASLVDVAEGSAAQQAQALLPAVTVVGAFQNLSAKKLLKGGGLDADVVVCGDAAEAKETVMDLAACIAGVRAVDGGPLANSRMVEAITVLLVSINRRYKAQAGIRIAGIE